MFDLFQKHPEDIQNIDAWFGRQKFDLILCIGDNHDRPLDENRGNTNQLFKNTVYLEDQVLVYKDITFYGTPWVPYLSDHAFYANEDTLQDKWAEIPVETDVLITHTPPYGMFDQSSRGLELGCRHLAKRVADVAPKIHCFGHVHAEGGMLEELGTTYINASSVDRPNNRLRQPVKLKI